MKRLIAVLLIVGGIAAVVAGIGSATWWKPAEEIHAKATSSSDSGIIVSAPGVLELVNDDVEVSAVAEGHTVDVIVAPTSTVVEWLGERPYAEVTSLKDWDTFAVEELNASAEPEVLDIAGADVFNLDNHVAKDNRVSLYFTVPEGDWSILAQTADGVTPTLEMSWTRSVETPWVWWFVVPGLLLALLGGYLFLNSAWEKPRIPTRHKTSKKGAQDAEESMSREGIAEKTGGALGAGIVPASPRADEFRNAELDPAERIVLLDEEELAGDDESENTADDETVNREETRENTGGALGAGIVPASPRADEFHNAELDPAERIVLPVAEVDADTSASSPEDVVVEHGEESVRTEESTDDDSESSNDDSAVVDEINETDGENDSISDGADIESDDPSVNTDEPGDGPEGTDEESTQTTANSDWRQLWGFGRKDNK